MTQTAIHTLLGDRHAAAVQPQAAAHEEVFRAVHGSVLQAVTENWADRRNANKQRRRDTRATLVRARNILRTIVRQRWRQQARRGKEEEFTDTWILSGAAQWRQGQPEPIMFELEHVPPPPEQGAIIASGDGAGPVGGCKRKAAGWGGVIYKPASQQRAEAELHLLAGPVATAPEHPEYIGATEPTNNAGEIIALTKMIAGAATVAMPGEHVEVQSDSMCAILAAFGGAAGTRRRRKRSKDPNAQLKRRLRATYVTARKRVGKGRLVIRKVRGHSGHIWNEIADALAGAGREADRADEAVATAELNDRIERALAAIGGAEIAEWSGVDWPGV